MDRLKSLKEQTIFFLIEWLRQKGLKKISRYLKADINLVLCVTNATINTLTERFLRSR